MKKKLTVAQLEKALDGALGQLRKEQEINAALRRQLEAARKRPRVDELARELEMLIGALRQGIGSYGDALGFMLSAALAAQAAAGNIAKRDKGK